MGVVSSLNLRNSVSVSRTTTSPDGMGGSTTTTTTTILPYAAIWQAGTSSPFISDQVLALSSHILVCRPTDDVLFTDEITYDGRTFEITGHPEDVQQRGQLKVVSLKEVN